MKQKKVPIKTMYYKDEINDEFSGISRNEKVIDESYTYINKSKLWNLLANLVYYGFALPAAFIYCKCKFSIKIYNKEVLKSYGREGYFLYSNHTQVPGDGFIQALVSFPRKNQVIVNADNVALKGTEQIMLMIGAMPLPTTRKGYKNFMAALDERCKNGESIVIYPEAHIWPYYTGIRNFKSSSFGYPIREKKATFSFTVIYKSRKYRATPRIEVKVDGPFYPNEDLTGKQAERNLRDQVYQTMIEHSQESNCEYIKYIKQFE